ncbi:hypothetical protein [Kitasatospora sp. NPDC002040]|uniref:hypothetical protein n=1 Tax=Kitasatospora sp. NPDC002040 TaxID=3154661 RepID=UPI0033255ADC
MTDHQQRLASALDALGAALAPDRLFELVGCTYCYDEDDRRLLAGPPDRVPSRLLASVVMRTPSHWEDFPGLFRRMAPAIVRAVIGNELHVDGAWVATRLVEADWQAWPLPARAALTEVWQAWLEQTLHRFPAPVPVAEVLELLAVSTGTLQPWLDLLAATRTRAAEQHLADLLEEWLVLRSPADLRLGFWAEFDAAPELLSWLHGLDRSRLTRTQAACLSSWPGI